MSFANTYGFHSDPTKNAYVDDNGNIDPASRSAILPTSGGANAQYMLQDSKGAFTIPVSAPGPGKVFDTFPVVSPVPPPVPAPVPVILPIENTPHDTAPLQRIINRDYSLHDVSHRVDTFSHFNPTTNFKSSAPAPTVSRWTHFLRGLFGG